MTKLEQLCKNMPCADAAAQQEAKRRLDAVAKPVGSLGGLEDAVIRLAGIERTADVDISDRTALVFCADNGAVRSGIAGTPPEVTALMAGFIAKGRSSVGVMAKHIGGSVMAVDMGMFTHVDEPLLLDRRIADGTNDMTKGPAMSREQAQRGVCTGIELVKHLKDRGCRLVITGEMGIGNTSTCAAVTGALLGVDPASLAGRGAGMTDEGYETKLAALRRAMQVNKPDGKDALDVLSKVGGFDIAGMCGAFIGGALYGVPVMIDGCISSAAALAASRLAPGCEYAMLASHISAEPAGSQALDALGLKALINAGLRLGEGTGAAGAVALIDLMLAVYRETITYADLGF